MKSIKTCRSWEVESREKMWTKSMKFKASKCLECKRDEKPQKPLNFSLFIHE